MFRTVAVIFVLSMIGCEDEDVLVSECRNNCSSMISKENFRTSVTWFNRASSSFGERAIIEMKSDHNDKFVCCCKIEKTQSSITKYVWQSEKICPFAKAPAERPPL